MYLSISTSGELSLEDIDEMKSFSIRQAGDASLALSEIGTATEDNHYWLDANAVIALSPRAADSQWVESFWQMLKAVEPYGYSDMENRRIKAHVEGSI